MTTKGNLLSEDDATGSTVTIKYGTGFESSWFVARGALGEIGEQLIAVFGLEPAPDATLNDLILAATSAAHGSYAALKGLPATPAAAPAADERPKWGSRSGGGDRSAAPTGAPAPNCAHGIPMQWRDFTSKAGNQVKGHFCVADVARDQECKPQYADKGGRR